MCVDILMYAYGLPKTYAINAIHYLSRKFIFYTVCSKKRTMEREQKSGDMKSLCVEFSLQPVSSIPNIGRKAVQHEEHLELDLRSVYKDKNPTVLHTHAPIIKSAVSKVSQNNNSHIIQCAKAKTCNSLAPIFCNMSLISKNQIENDSSSFGNGLGISHDKIEFDDTLIENNVRNSIIKKFKKHKFTMCDCKNINMKAISTSHIKVVYSKVKKTTRGLPTNMSQRFISSHPLKCCKLPLITTARHLILEMGKPENENVKFVSYEDKLISTGQQRRHIFVDMSHVISKLSRTEFD